MMVMVLNRRRPLCTPEDAIHHLLKEETTASLTKGLRDAFMGATILSQRGGYCGGGQGSGCGGDCGGGGHGGHGGSGGTGDSHESMCTYCKIDSDTTDVHRKCKDAQEGGNNGNDKCICLQCRLPVHVKVDCISYKYIKEWWRVKIATNTAALTTTGDCDPFWITACTLATAATIPPPKWVIDSGTPHHICNDCSRFWTFKKLSLCIVITLADNNWVIVAQYGFIDVIQGYQIEALHIPAFGLSLLSINQLDLGRHTTKFQNGLCSITSPSSYTLARKLMNGICMIVPATTLPSLTTENWGKRKQDSAMPRVLIAAPLIEPTVGSSRAPVVAKIKPTRKSLSIP